MAERRDDDIDIEEQADAVADFVEELLTRMDIDAIAEPSEEGGRMYVDILDGDDADMALLIGKQGATLDAIQELARQVVGRRLDQRIRVLVDVEDYRKRRTSKVEEKAGLLPSAPLSRVRSRPSSLWTPWSGRLPTMRSPRWTGFKPSRRATSR